MARIAISITKQVTFRDSIQEFSNTYHYTRLGSNPDQTDANNLIDELVALEKTWHSTAVTFLRARCWSAGGTPAQNVTISQKLLSGTGSMTTTTSFDRERAYLIQWNAGVDSRGRQVKLRKWFHSSGFFGTHALGDGILSGTTGFTSTERTAIGNKADAATRLGADESWHICAESGREAESGAGAVAHKYLEHHQLGDQWRG